MTAELSAGVTPGGAPAGPGAPPAGPGLPPAPEEPHGSRARAVAEATARWAMALTGAVVIFAAILVTKGADPVQVFTDAWVNTILNRNAVEEILVKAGPFALAALAVVVPSRAGLVNVGGEGQVLVGAVASAGVALYAGDALGGAALPVMLLAGVAAGAAWAGIAAVLRITVNLNEAVSTLLLNYIALDLVLALIYQPWKDPDGSGQPASPPLADAEKLPVFTGTTVHVGLALVVVAAAVVWALFRYTAWGFRLRAVGGNPEAARRAGLPVTRLLLTAMLVGGGLAGLAGAIHLTGVEYQLRPGFAAQIGYVGFLASWLARHRPGAVLVASVVMAALVVAGDSLQIDSNLPAATVNILTGLILAAVLGWTGTRKAIR